MVNYSLENMGIKAFIAFCNYKGEERGVTEGIHNGPLDAFRHAYMSAVLTYWWGAEEARKMASGYEQDYPNPPQERAMDEFNNAVGRRVGQRFSQIDAVGIYNKLADAVKQALDNGELVTSLEDERISSLFTDREKTGVKSKHAESDLPKSGQYIWRTAGDKKVRYEHAIREGKIFSWENPPPDGHPGEAYGCRCTAEPVMESEKDAIPLAAFFRR